MQVTPPTIPTTVKTSATIEAKTPTEDVVGEFLSLLRSKVRRIGEGGRDGKITAETAARQIGVPYTSVRNWIYGVSAPRPYTAAALLAKMKSK